MTQTHTVIRYLSGFTPSGQADSRLVTHHGKTFMLQDLQSGDKGLIVVLMCNTAIFYDVGVFVLDWKVFKLSEDVNHVFGSDPG